MNGLTPKTAIWLVLLGMPVCFVLVGFQASDLWACPNCSAEGDWPNCSLCALLMYKNGIKQENDLAPSGPESDDYQVQLEGPFAMDEEGNPCDEESDDLDHWKICVYCRVGEAPDDPYEKDPGKEFVNKSSDPSENPYKCTDDAVTAWVEYNGVSCKTLHGANADVVMGSIEIKGDDGTIMLKLVYNGAFLETVYRGRDKITREWMTAADHRPKTVTVERGAVVIRKTYYRYTAHDDGNRTRMTVEEYNSDGTKRFLTTIYGYHPEGAQGDEKGRLWYVVRSEGVNRYMADNNAYGKGIDPFEPGAECGLDKVGENEVSHEDLLDYASDVCEEYTLCPDGHVRVTKLKKSDGGGCGGCGGAGTYELAYEFHTPSHPVTDWRMCRRIKVPGGLRIVEYSSLAGHLLYEIRQKMTGETVDDVWITHYVYHADGQEPHEYGLLKEHRYPSACKAYTWEDTNADGWIDYTEITPDEDDDEGLVEVYNYHEDSRRLTWVRAKKGTGGTPYFVRKYVFDSEGGLYTTYNEATYNNVTTYGGKTVYRPWMEIAYETALQTPGQNDGLKTVFKYTYHQDGGDTHAVKTKEVTHPTVSVAKNGPGSATKVTYHYKLVDPVEQGGELVHGGLHYNDWTKHEDGRYSYTKLGTGQFNYGQVVKTVVDADSGGNGEDFPTIDGWQLPQDGLDLTTEYKYYGEASETGSYARLKSVARPGGQKAVHAYLSRLKTHGTAPNEKVTTTALIALITPHMDGNDYSLAPLRITVSDLDGRTLISGAGDATTDGDGILTNDLNSNYRNCTTALRDLNTGFEGSLTTRTDRHYNDDYRLEKVHHAHTIHASGEGALGTNYYRTFYRYDDYGRKIRDIQVVSGTQTSSSVEQVTKYEYDQRGRLTEVHRGVSPATGDDSDMGGDYSNDPDDKMKKVKANFYDESTPGSGTSGVGDGRITSTLAYYDADNIDEDHAVETIYRYDYRGHRRGVEPEVSPFTVYDVDNLGRVVAVAQFTSTTLFGANWATVLGDPDYAETIETNRRSLSTTLYDERGRVYQGRVYSVNSSGVKGDRIETNNYCDARGRLVATTSPGRGGTEYAYDGAGRQTEVRLVKELEITKYDAQTGEFQYRAPLPGASTGGDDLVIQIARTTYDAAGNATESIRLEANHDDTDGLDVSNDDDYVQTATYAWYDAVGRITDTAAYGTCDGDGKWEYSALTARPPDPPTYQTQDVIDGKILLATYAYNDAGRLETVTDPENIAATTTYDDLGRTTQVEEDQGGAKERTTLTEYDGLSNVTKLCADLDNDNIIEEGTDEVTTYTYYDSTRSPYHAGLTTKIKYPDGDTSDDNVKFTYDLDGRVKTRTAQKTGAAANVITFDYDVTFRRLTQRNVTTVGTGVDDTVQSITTRYDSLGRREYVTSHTDFTPDTDTFTDALNQVQYTYNDLGQREKEYQEHEGKVDSDTLYVQYNYDDTDSTPNDGVYDKAMRPKSLRYPSYSANHYTRTAGQVAARLLHGLYVDAGGGSGIGDAISRVTALSNEATRADEDEVYSTYAYNGAGRIVVEDYVQPDVRLDYWGQTNDTYAGFDRFGRVKQQLWRDHGANQDRDKFTYGYDRNSNRLWRDNAVASVAGKKLDEQYEYDNLNRLDKFRRGVLDGDTIPTTGDDCTRRENWGLSPVGNWNDYQIDSDGDDNFTDAADLDQDRTHNLVNEIWNETPANAITEGQGQTAWASPVYSARGNMTGVPKPSDLTAVYTVTYDAWNRLAFVWVDSNADGDHDAGETVIARYEYDGLNHRTKKHLNADTDDDFDEYRHFYYNASWQILETRKATNVATEPQTLQPEYQYVWSLRYIDAPVLRDENTDEDDLCDDKTLYYLTDANMNVTCLTDTGGDAVERYVYDPYGNCTVYNSDWSATVAWADSKKNPIRFCGYYFDNETGLYTVRHRTLHAYLGWLNRDPIGYQYCASLYCYGASMPTRMLDPSGTRCGECAPPGVGYPNVYNVRTRFRVTSRKADPDTIDWDTALTALTVIKVAAAVKDLGGGAAGSLAKGGTAAAGAAKGAASRGFKTGKSYGLQDACLEGVEDIKESAKGPTAGNLGLALWVLLKYESCEPCCPLNPFQWGGAQDHEWVEHEAKYHCTGFGDYPNDTTAYFSEEAAAKDEAKCAKLAEQALREGRL